jgi:hypothetical protein
LRAVASPASIKEAIHTFDLHTYTWLDARHWDDEVEKLPSYTNDTSPYYFSSQHSSYNIQRTLWRINRDRDASVVNARMMLSLASQFGGGMRAIATCGQRSIQWCSRSQVLLYIDQSKERWCRIQLPSDIQLDQYFNPSSATLSPLV